MTFSSKLVRGVVFSIYLLGMTISAHAEDKITIFMIGGKMNGGRIVVKERITLAAAIGAAGGLDWNEAIFLVRNGKGYLLNQEAQKAGAFDLLLKNNDAVTILENGTTFESLKSRGIPIVVGLKAIKELSATPAKK